ncbi:hypothetical protein Lser_V15G03675 [Lactuca serriola]
MRMLKKEKLHGSVELKTNVFGNMYRLMLLQLNYVQMTGSYKNFPEELRWLCMHGFPLKSIPSELPMENLVSLDMSYSKIESFGIHYSFPQRLHKRLKQLIGSCSKDKRLLGSLKILNLSFCEQLYSLSGFDHLPSLERLILKGCIGLLEVCLSVEQCLELILVDLSYCNKLEKLPRIIGMLKRVKKIFLNGCYLGESQIKIRDMDSIEKFKANSTGVNTKLDSSAILEVIPSDLRFFTVSLPRSLVSLSLKDNNLSTESFPMDFSCLSMLKELYLDENPIVSLPNCVRSLPRLETLSMVKCNMLTSVEHPPHTLTFMKLYFDSKRPSLRKVIFHPQMSPLDFFMDWKMLAPSSFEIEGMVKTQPMESVEEKVLCRLGWTKLDSHNDRCVVTCTGYRGREECEMQMYYEFGIFSTIYGGQEMPSWITDRSTGPSISFTIPSSPNKLTGLNFCFVQTPLYLSESFYLPLIKISNITKNLTWIYQHYLDVVYLGGKCLTLLSHWMFGSNEMECGDHVTITITQRKVPDGDAVTKECGVSFVYDDGENKVEEDVLGYYKSWNHIIGGDLTGFQSTTGEYILKKSRILRPYIDTYLLNSGNLSEEGARLIKDKQVYFKALSQRKSAVMEDGP